jgi:signal transduction histidine kinase/CheY-like chemotaxis protein
MPSSLLHLEIRYEQDVVLARRSARQLAELLGFDMQDQVRLATATSEIARNAFQYADGGTAEFWVEEEAPQQFLIRIHDRGPGIADLKQVLEGHYRSSTGMGLGILGAKRLMDRFEIESSPEQGTVVLLGKLLPTRAIGLMEQRLSQIQAVANERSPQNPFEEIQHQNQELLRTMAELRKREEELTQLNRELEDTNRGVVALYAELDEKALSLQQANEMKTRFLSNMSHEFRTPLNSVISLSRILLDRMDGELTAEQEKQISFIRRAAEGLTELVNDLLDLAKVEAGKTEVHSSEFEVSALFGTLRGMLRPLLEHNSSVSLVFEEPVGVPSLYTDEGKVAQILRNFISNALKFTERGEVRVSAALTNQTVTLSVADTGIGIAPADQERIFEDFVQVDSPLQRKMQGTGLGLPLSRKLAELLGGKVSVSSEVGCGSKFSVSLPIATSNSPRVILSSADAWELDPTRRLVLVVEDHAETLFAYKKFFERSAYQLVAVQTIEAAEQVLQAAQPVVLILDILLKNQHTWTFLTNLKRDQETCDIPVLVVTVVDNERQSLVLGADGFLIKPVDRWSLLHKVNTLVRREQPQKLLLIDDDPAARYVLRQWLAPMSLEILEAADGREGLQLAQAEQPQAIVLDLTLPELGGTDILELLKRDTSTQAIPVIINTSRALEAEEQRGLAEKSVAILLKTELSQGTASACLQQALLQAGVAVELEASPAV